jgi:hypothetical protein
LNVWSVRRSWRARVSSPGTRRHARTLSPACGVELRGLLEEDRQHLRVDVVADVSQRIVGDFAPRELVGGRG